MLSPHKQKSGYFKRSSYMKIKMHVKENFFFLYQKWGLTKMEVVFNSDSSHSLSKESRVNITRSQKGATQETTY